MSQISTVEIIRQHNSAPKPPKSSYVHSTAITRSSISGSSSSTSPVARIVGESQSSIASTITVTSTSICKSSSSMRKSKYIHQAELTISFLSRCPQKPMITKTEEDLDYDSGTTLEDKFANERQPSVCYCPYNVEHQFKSLKERETHEAICP